MSQRNPMNERYTTDNHTGTTRKSAASAKPKSKAASSVTVAPAKKTPQQKKAEQKKARKEAKEKQRELDRKYYTPDTQRYKNLRRLWWVLLILAIACTVASFIGQNYFSSGVGMVVLVLAYVFIIAAFVVDFMPIRKERNAYQERMLAEEERLARKERAAKPAENTKPKSSGKNQNRHAAQKPKTAGDDAASDDADESAADDKAAEEKPRRKLFGGRKKENGAANDAADAVQENEK